MTTINMNSGRQGERGNVLFLILIAVALFAALSYAVTQSTRSGAGDTGSETNLISSAQLSQYPAGIRTAIVRMIIAGAPLEELLFTVPADFEDDLTTEPLRRRAIFHPQGGGAIYTMAPREALSSSSTGQWYFNANGQIRDVGQTDDGVGEFNDLIAFLPGVTESVCRKINEAVGIGTTIPTGPAYTPTGGPESTTDYMDVDYNFATATTDAAFTIGADDSSPLRGQPFGCYNNGGTYVYYHVLLER